MTMHDIVDNATLLSRHNITFTIFRGFLTLAGYLIPQKQFHFILDLLKFRDGHKGQILFPLFLSFLVLQHLQQPLINIIGQWPKHYVLPIRPMKCCNVNFVDLENTLDHISIGHLLPTLRDKSLTIKRTQQCYIVHAFTHFWKTHNLENII